MQALLKVAPAVFKFIMDSFDITRTLPHGHVAARLTAQRGMASETAVTPRGAELLLGVSDENDLTAAMGGLVARQDQIAPGLVKTAYRGSWPGSL